MSQTIKIKKGFQINLKGKAEKKVVENFQPKTFAVKPTDFLAINRPKLLVSEGDSVKAGTPLFYDKFQEDVMYCSPVSGEVAEIKRGQKRKLLEVIILADSENAYLEFDKYSTSDIANLDTEAAKSQMVKAGVWPHIIQRPFGIVANPADTPKSIFISAFDTHPLAPDYDVLFKGQESHFQAGIDVLSKLTSGKINIGINGKEELSKVFSNVRGAEINRFEGKHPVGNVGTHIAHIDPINKGDVVWTLNPFGVISIGRLFIEGKYDASKLVPLTGSEIKNPQYYKTYAGACIESFLKDNTNSDHVRCISGNVLTGERIAHNGFLGFYDHQFTVIPEGDYQEMFGWILPSANKLSFHKAFGLLSFLNPSSKEYVVDTNTHGEKRAFVQTGVLERVMAIDVLPTFLVKAIMAEDYDEMEALGIYELVEEDIALCEFIDVSKHDLQATLREGLDLLRLNS